MHPCPYGPKATESTVAECAVILANGENLPAMYTPMYVGILATHSQLEFTQARLSSRL